MGVLHGFLEKRPAVVVVRIVDVRIPDRVVVEVHDRRACRANLFRVEFRSPLAEVPVPVAEVRLHVEFMERRDVEVEVPLRALWRVLPLGAERRHVGGLLQRHRAVAGGPAFGHSQLLPRIVGVDERPPVVRALEAHGEAAVDAAHPHRVAVERLVPLLLNLPLWERPAVIPEALPETRDARRHGDFKRRPRDLAAHVTNTELTRPREVDATFDDTFHATFKRGLRTPRCVRGRAFGEGKPVGRSPRDRRRAWCCPPCRFAELHRRGEKVHSLLDEARIGAAEKRDDLRGQAVLAQNEFAPEDLHRAARLVNDDRRVRLRHRVLASDVRVEPLEARETPGVADAAVLQRRALDLDLERNRPRLAAVTV